METSGIGKIKDAWHKFRERKSQKKSSQPATATSAQIETRTTPELHTVDDLQRFIAQGIDLLKDRQFSASIDHFSYVEIDPELGLRLDLTNTSAAAIMPDIPVDEVNYVLFHVTTSSHMNFGVIKPSYCHSRDPDRSIPPVITHHVALLHAEEWLHGLQFVLKQPLAGYENKEVDVAAYMIRQGVPLTDYFLGIQAERWVLADEFPELRERFAVIEENLKHTDDFRQIYRTLPEDY